MAEVMSMNRYSSQNERKSNILGKLRFSGSERESVGNLARYEHGHMILSGMRFAQ